MGYRFAVSSYIHQTLPSLDYLWKTSSEFAVAANGDEAATISVVENVPLARKGFRLLQYCAAVETCCIR